MVFHVSTIYIKKSEYTIAHVTAKIQVYIYRSFIYVHCNFISRFWSAEQFYCETSLGDFKCKYVNTSFK